MTPSNDSEAWLLCTNDRWIYNRLDLAQRLGYDCGPGGTPFPTPGPRFAKPIINLWGFGAGARVVGTAPEVGPGEFWMPIFHGPHLSVDYENGTPVFVVEAEYGRVDGLVSRWVRRENSTAKVLPEVLRGLRDTSVVNVEFIGGNVTEAHLRRNEDFWWCPNADYATVVWDGDMVPADMVADEQERWGSPVKRLGFVFG